MTRHANFLIELSDENLKMHLDVRILWGRRRASTDEPAPPVSLPRQHYGPIDDFMSFLNDREQDSNSFEHKRLRIYDSQKEYQQIAIKRRKQSGWNEPIPFVHRRPLHRSRN